MQRTGRKGHAMFRVVVQDSRRTPTSGKIVANLGSYNPHTKQITLDKEKAQFYLDHGAQPSDRVVVILSKEGIKLPDWVKEAAKKDRTVRNPEKRRSTAPDEPQEEAEVEEPATGENADSAKAETTEEAPESASEEKPAAEPASEENSSEAKESDEESK